MSKNSWSSFRYKRELMAEKFREFLGKFLKVNGYNEHGSGIVGLLRQWLRERKLAAGIVLSVLTIAFLLFTVSQLMPGALSIGTKEQHKKAWFYDLNTGELFVTRFKSIPPIDAPSGPLANGEPAGVRAYVYRYAGQAEDEKFIAYIEKFTPQAADLMKSRDKEIRAKAWQEGRLVRRTDGKEWVSANSPAGMAADCDMGYGLQKPYLLRVTI